MFKIILVVVLLIGFSYLFLPYLIDLFGFFTSGQNQLTTIFNYIIDFIKTCFNILSTNSYIMIFFTCLLFISLIFYLINYVGDR